VGEGARPGAGDPAWEAEMGRLEAAHLREYNAEVAGLLARWGLGPARAGAARRPRRPRARAGPAGGRWRGRRERGGRRSVVQPR